MKKTTLVIMAAGMGSRFGGCKQITPLDEHGHVIMDYSIYDAVLAGFDKIDSVIGGGWYTDDDESTIADLARSLGVNLKFTSYVRYCTKHE